MNSRVVIDEATGPLLVDEAPSAAAVPRAGWISLAYLSLGHFFIDFYSNALGAFVPLLVDKLGITLTQAGFLGGLLSCSSSVMQPM
jgi:hypothetical protein